MQVRRTRQRWQVRKVDRVIEIPFGRLPVQGAWLIRKGYWVRLQNTVTYDPNWRDFKGYIAANFHCEMANGHQILRIKTKVFEAAVLFAETGQNFAGMDLREFYNKLNSN